MVTCSHLCKYVHVLTFTVKVCTYKCCLSGYFVYQGEVVCFVSALYVLVEILQVIFLFIYDTLWICTAMWFALLPRQPNN